MQTRRSRVQLFLLIGLVAMSLIACTATPEAVSPTQQPTQIPQPPTATSTDASTLAPSPTLEASLEASPAPSTTTEFVGPDHLRVEVVAKYPHDTTAFTEGLVWHDGKLYESAGYYAISLREVELETGSVLRTRGEQGNHFGEGITLVGDEIILLTWQEQTAYRYDRATFEPLGTFTYSGEGWGICYDGTTLYQSDGSPAISLRNPQTFEFLSAIQVTLDGQPVEELNELECVADSIFANVWFSTNILRIDKATGMVTGVIDASGLLMPEETPLDHDGVLNGIAYVPERDTFLITGKLWPWVFEVRFVPAGG